MAEVKLFSGENSAYLAEKIASNYGEQLSDVTINRFSDGEMQPIINQSVRGTYVFFIQSTFPPADNMLELLLMIDSAKRASANYITAVIPYFGYARQDRKDKARVPISAKLISNILQAAGADRVVTMDLHAEQIQGFFDIPVDHLKSEAIFMPYLATQNMENVIFASPDVGGVKRARAYSKHFEKNLVICDKERRIANQVAAMTVIGDVKGFDVILVDDMVDTAGTLCKAAEVLMAEGAKSVRAICTHPILSGPAFERIDASVIERVYVTDTIPLKQTSDKLTVLSCADLFAKAIRNTHEYRSIAALFMDGM
ncbi:MAG: ribose-phosphate pyrophosphokinase [Saprospiraceae bacterium]|nr:ribose-phosphate pyrophosphokinase [Saprospiraceae bacterium]